MAERGGFEPPVHLCGHTHDFQSCSFSRSDIPPYIEITQFFNGGERGIRTPVGAFGPQIDFESIPLRPLRYLSAYYILSLRGACGVVAIPLQDCRAPHASRQRAADVILFSRKNPLIISVQASARTPSVIATEWLSFPSSRRW
jgi:hypothetical protein